jgi:chemotaxis protein methyltransferase CheR
MQPEEVQVAVDLLTTNETYFFRENKHFDFLREQAQARTHRQASLPGVERRQFQRRRGLQHGHGAGRLPARRQLGDLGTDISTQVLENARAACTPWSAGAIAARVPAALLPQGHG